MKSRKEAKARGRSLHALRTELKLSLSELAERSKVSVPMLSQAERGNRNLSNKAQSRVEKAFANEIERRKKIRVLRDRLMDAQDEVARCQLDILRNQYPADALPQAQKRCAEISAELKSMGALDDPIVCAVLESHQREIERMKADAGMLGQAYMMFAVAYVEALRAGERGAPMPPPFPPYAELEKMHAEALRQLNETGKVSMPGYASVVEGVREILKEEKEEKKPK
jgi:transcriptional regulator with XRE-family HTH domain